MSIVNILEKIVAYKKQEITLNETNLSLKELEKKPGFNREVLSMKNFLKAPDRTGIIAEFKRKSPSKGIINNTATVEQVTAAYARHGASVISVLTDGPSFGGSFQDLQDARFNSLPILRKDFILDPYQVIETRAIGADVILLIAACLTPKQTKNLAKIAHDTGLEVLLEIYSEEELDHLCDDIDVVGINNRDLKTFVVDIDRSIRLAEQLPTDKLRVAESGIRDIATVNQLRSKGFDGFLIGEQFMKTTDPAIAFASFADQLKMSCI